MSRGRPPLINPTRAINLHIDAGLAKLIDERLWSEAEQRVPKGAYQAFFTEAAIRMMRMAALDLSPFAGTLPTEHVVLAFPGTKEVLVNLLMEQSHDSRIPGNAIEDSDLAREG